MRLCEAAPCSQPHFFEDLEVQDPAPRAQVSIALEIHESSRSHFFAGPSGDVTEGGVFIATGRLLAIGSFVDLELSLRGLEVAVRVRGVVRWIREGGLGIAFAELSDEDRYHIYDFCSTRPALDHENAG